MNERYYNLSEASEMILNVVIGWFLSPIRRIVFLLYVFATILFILLERTYNTGLFLALAYICFLRLAAVIMRRYSEEEQGR
mgnify:FL=1